MVMLLQAAAPADPLAEALYAWPLVAAGVAAGLVILAELLHLLRVRRVRYLAFGRGGQPALWVRALPALRGAAAGALAWGLTTLLLIEPQVHSAQGVELKKGDDYHHVLIVLDVSPSMRLVDAGPKRELSRMQRARELLESFFKRVPLDQFRISVVATYNGAKPVVVDTTDLEVVRNILGDLPMHFAFKSGKTRLLDGIEEATKLARPWNPASTTLVIVSDGDTVPSSGMPRMPASIASTLVVGVGDPLTGKFIDGQQSRQDVSTLRQIATRLGGAFHNGNELHLASSLLGDLAAAGGTSQLEVLGRREYALIAAGAGAGVLAILPLALQLLGSAYRPGRRRRRSWAGGAPAGSIESSLRKAPGGSR